MDLSVYCLANNNNIYFILTIILNTLLLVKKNKIKKLIYKAGIKFSPKKKKKKNLKFNNQYNTLQQQSTVL